MLNKKILSYKTRSLLRKDQVIRANTAYDKAVQVGILFSIDDLGKHEMIKNFIQRLKNDGKQVSVLAYLPKKKENHEFLFDFFTAKQLSFWGKFTSQEVITFAKKPFDYLFYIDQQSNPMIRNILAMSQAKCRVGKYDALNADYCELMINATQGNLKELVDEMYKYTKKIS